MRWAYAWRCSLCRVRAPAEKKSNMRTHSQITAKLMRRPGVRDEVELLVGSTNVYADPYKPARQGRRVHRVGTPCPGLNGPAFKHNEAFSTGAVAI